VTMKAKKVFRYIVAGSGHFPDDMLRYDCGVIPSSADDSVLTVRERLSLPYREIVVTSPYQPTTARWESFGWRVLFIETVR